MRKLYEDTSSLTYNDLAKRKDTKKDAAQKFYSLLVLQKVPFRSLMMGLNFKYFFFSSTHLT